MTIHQDLREIMEAMLGFDFASQGERLLEERFDAIEAKGGPIDRAFTRALAEEIIVRLDKRGVEGAEFALSQAARVARAVAKRNQQKP